MRVVSLAPSATNIVAALGAERELVASTDHCNAEAQSVGGWLNPDLDRVAAYDPDVVLLTDALQEHLDVPRDEDYDLVHVDPRTLSDVYDSIMEIADVLDRTARGADVVAEMRAGFTAVRESVPDSPDDRPVVYCEEWSDPPMAAGNWVPEIVSLAGGQYPFAAPGERSTPITQEEFERGSPDYVVLHVCGAGEDVSTDEILTRGWNAPAVRNDAISVIDDSLLNQPAPQLVTAAQELARMFHD
ncbi:MAG: helical backbone metal receptor [Haloarculaceae archaeon]